MSRPSPCASRPWCVDDAVEQGAGTDVASQGRLDGRGRSRARMLKHVRSQRPAEQRVSTTTLWSKRPHGRFAVSNTRLFLDPPRGDA
jgi:hypothetical protein